MGRASRRKSRPRAYSDAIAAALQEPAAPPIVKSRRTRNAPDEELGVLGATDYEFLTATGRHERFLALVDEVGFAAAQETLAGWRYDPVLQTVSRRYITDRTTSAELYELLGREPEACARVAFAALTRARARGVQAGERLQSLSVATAALETFRARLVGQLRADGVSWAEIGAALGISLQAAHKRYGG